MIDLNTHINNYGKPNAIIDFNGNNGILAGIWGIDQIIECINGQTFINGELIRGNPLDILQENINNWQINSNIFSAIGFFSYDFKNIIYPHIPYKSIHNSIPQYWFGKPKKIEIIPELFLVEPVKNSILFN